MTPLTTVCTTLGQGQEMTLTSNTHICSYIQLDVCFYQISDHWLQQFLKNPLFSLLPIEKPVSKFDLTVIICTNYDGQGSPKLHTKFRENRPAGSFGEDF